LRSFGFEEHEHTLLADVWVVSTVEGRNRRCSHSTERDYEYRGNQVHYCGRIVMASTACRLISSSSALKLSIFCVMAPWIALKDVVAVPAAC
jgi:hypothetical protein